MPDLKDPNFSRAVLYICEHSEQGAMGVAINKPLDIGLADIFQQIDINVENSKVSQQFVFHGGPVQQERGFILHSPLGKWQSSLHVTDEIAITTSQDVLNSIAQGNEPQQSIIALGYAGWGAGQLEKEILDNSWLHCPASSELLFDTPFDLQWKSAVASIGIDVAQLSSTVGHA
jgi:putative transcriptional regulator